MASVGEALVALDRDGRPTCRTIAWYDERPKREVAFLEAELGKERLHALTGLAVDPTFSLCKLLWLKANQPDAIARTALWLNVCHYLAWRLTGVAGRRPDARLALARARPRPAGLGGGADPRGRARSGAVRAAPPLGHPARQRHRGRGRRDRPHHRLRGRGRRSRPPRRRARARALAPGVLFNSMGTAEALTFVLERPSTEPSLCARGYNQGVVEVERPVHYVFGGFPTSGACIEWFRGAVRRRRGARAADRRGLRACRRAATA